MFADRADTQADRRLEHDDVRDREQQQRQPDHQVELPDGVVEEVPETVRGNVREESQVHVWNGRQVVRRAVVAIVLVVEVAGDPEGQEVDGGPDHDLVRTQSNREDRMHEREQCAREDADE